MTAHLLLMSLGPVQEFIAQARRTRDLWFGSHVLSELSRKAAAATRAAGAELIFPALPEGPEAVTGLPNKLLARMTQGEPRAVARAARDAARGCLRDWGLRIWAEREQLVDRGMRAAAAAEEQLETFLEFHAAWSPIEATENGYREALTRVEDALAGRKRLRAFSPWAHQRGGIQKSSLDGARESVLSTRSNRQGGDWQRFRIGRREQLDAIGLLKRTGGTPGQFVPVPTIGLAAYTARAKKDCGADLAKLTEACQRLRERKVLTAVSAQGKDWVRDFPFDAQLLLPGRWRTHLEEQGLPREEAEAFGGLVRPLLKELGEPYPYVVCLSADGDRMGQTLRELASHGYAKHQALSRALTDFAGSARRIIEKEHRGVLVYAGGDDVLAFVCLPDALECAAGLRQAFIDATREVLEPLGVTLPTLSVGLGIGHVLESLGDLLNLGRRAERLAKGTERDGLALVARLHSGREHTWRMQWTDGPVEVLASAIRLREEGRLPLKKFQEVEALLRRMPRAVGAEWGLVLAREVGRVLGRVEAGSEGGLKPGDVGLTLGDGLPLAEVHARVAAWTERLWMAELLSRANPRERETAGGAP